MKKLKMLVIAVALALGCAIQSVEPIIVAPFPAPMVDLFLSYVATHRDSAHLHSKNTPSTPLLRYLGEAPSWRFFIRGFSVG